MRPLSGVDKVNKKKGSGACKEYGERLERGDIHSKE